MFDGDNLLRADQDINLLRARIGMVFQKPTPFPMSIYENIAFGVRLYETLPRAELDGRVETGAAPRRPVGRGQGQARRQRPEPVGRPAAAAVHRPHRRGEARGHPVRRAVLGARSDLDRQDRGADRRAEAGLHDRHRHPQHAAGGTRLGLHRLHVSRRADRVRRRPKPSSPRPRTAAPRPTSPAASADNGEQQHGRTYPEAFRRGAGAAERDHQRDGRPGREPARAEPGGAARARYARSPSR